MEKTKWIHKFSGISCPDLIWISIGIFLTHLIMNSLVLMLFFNQILDHISRDFVNTYTAIFSLAYISSVIGLLFSEIVMFLLGWLYIMAAVTLLNGQQNARLLFSWLGISYTPIVLSSFFIFALLLLCSECTNYTDLANMSTIEQLPREVEKLINYGWFKWLRSVRYLAFALTIMFSCEVVSRICMVPRSKAIGIISAYVIVQGLTHIYVL